MAGIQTLQVKTKQTSVKGKTFLLFHQPCLPCWILSISNWQPQDSALQSFFYLH